MEEKEEDITLKNDEGEDQPQGQEESTDEGSDDELAKAKKAYESQKVRAEKAEKARKELEAELAKAKKPEKETPKNEELSEPDYAKLAFLEGKGVKHPDDQKIVQDEAKRLKLPLTDVLGMEHIQSKLKNSATQREAEAGMPDSTGKSGGANKSSVEYWINKKNKDGSYATPTDLELAEKVIDARIKKEQNQSMFSDDLF